MCRVFFIKGRDVATNKRLPQRCKAFARSSQLRSRFLTDKTEHREEGEKTTSLLFAARGASFYVVSALAVSHKGLHPHSFAAKFRAMSLNKEKEVP